MDIVLGVFHNILHIVGEAVRQKSRDEMVATLSVKDMDDVGRSKVRFVGAWAVSRVLKSAKKYVSDNIYTLTNATRSKVNKIISKIQALESVIVMPFEILSSETKYPGTLEVTESRQFRTKGLIHVSDEYYEFTLELEQKRVKGLNSKMLKVHGENLVEVVQASLLQDEELKTLWKGLFTNANVSVRFKL